MLKSFVIFSPLVRGYCISVYSIIEMFEVLRVDRICDGSTLFMADGIRRAAREEDSY